jgi:hypothetical protein
VPCVLQFMCYESRQFKLWLNSGFQKLTVDVLRQTALHFHYYVALAFLIPLIAFAILRSSVSFVVESGCINQAPAPAS